MVKDYRDRLGFKATSSDSELAAFTAYAQAFPDGLLALVDTYDTLQSGVPNFLCVALALDDLGHRLVLLLMVIMGRGAKFVLKRCIGEVYGRGFRSI